VRRRLPGLVLVALAAAVALALPPLLGTSQLTVYVLLGLAAIVTTGVGMLMGYAGQVSLGQAAFYAVGAYTAGLMAAHGLPPLLGLACAPLVAAAAAALVGVPLLRLRGHYLAFATVALQLILLSVAGQASFTGGDIGLQGVPQFAVGGVTLSGGVSYAYLTLAAVALVLLLTRNVIGSRPGRGLRALATSEAAAASAGVPVGRYKLAVFSLSAAYAGLAGGIYAFYLGYVAPGSFPVLLSFEYVVMAVVGGLGTLWGAVAGATVVTLLQQALTQLGTRPGMPSYAPGVLSYALYGLLLVLVLLFLPRGLLPGIAAWRARRAAGAAAPEEASVPASAAPEMAPQLRSRQAPSEPPPPR
jgi:branched-chain amino acid transport system permease protein